MKKILSILISICVIASTLLSVPLVSMAATEGALKEVENPLYTGKFVETANVRLASNNWMKSIGPKLRDAMVERQEEFSFDLTSSVMSTGSLDTITRQLVDYATSQELSISAVDGDYIAYQWKSFQVSYKYSYGSDIYKLTISFEYRDSAKDERQIDRAVSDYLATVDLTNTSDYALLREFHDYVMEITEYNNDDINNGYNYSCYGVFGRGKAVCQGYALAFYRLCKEAGFDVRVMQSDETGCHAWNIVYIGNSYYYVDCTWDDDNYDHYYYFLVDYTTLQSYDTSSHEHLLDSEYYKNDNDFNNNVKNNVSATCWSTGTKSLGNCTVAVNSSNVGASVVKFGSTTLVNGTDYTISSDSKHFAVITGKGNYAGSKTSRIKRLNYLTPSLSYSTTSYDGSFKMPAMTISGLKQGTDFLVYYSDNLNAGTALATAQGIGRYRGTVTEEFKINKASIADFDVQLSFTSSYYDGYDQIPEVTVEGLKQGTDYTVSGSPVKLGKGTLTITGINNCTSVVTKSFEIVKHKISEKDISLYDTDYVYTGKAIKPSVYISGMYEGTDYKVSYSSNKLPGIAKAKISGMNYYDGSKTLYFYIHPKDTAASKSTVTNSSVKLKWNSSKGADGYEIRQYKSGKFKKIKTVSADKLSYTVKGLKSGTQYKFKVYAYTNTTKKTLYSDAEAVTVKTKGPKPAAIKKLTSSKKSVTVKWGKVSSAAGYEIQYAKKSNFSDAKTKKVGASKTSATISKLKKGKKYYVRIRAYKITGGKKIYSTWSAKKSITVK